MKVNQVLCGDAFELLDEFEDNSIDSVPTDGPYGLGFMNKEWDKFTAKEYQEFCFKWGTKVLRVIKPGSYVASFSAPRKYHRMVCGLEDAGFKIKDMINWVFGSGFPKSLDISKAIDIKPNANKVKKFKKWLGNQINNCSKNSKEINEQCGFTATSYRKYDAPDGWASNLPSKKKWNIMKEIIGISNEWDWIIENNIEERGFLDKTTGGMHGGSGNSLSFKREGKQLADNPISKDAKKWLGWGTGLKPAHEPIVLAQKPYEGTYAENVLKWGVGGLNINACRIEYNINKEVDSRIYNQNKNITRGSHENATLKYAPDGNEFPMYKTQKGRWPSNLLLDDISAKIVDRQSGDCPTGDISPYIQKGKGIVDYAIVGKIRNTNHKGDKGGASRFFYCAKAHKSERNAGLLEVEETPNTEMVNRKENSAGIKNPRAGAGRGSGARNNIVTLKPINLMRYIIRLITPPNGTVLDMFAGSGTTGIACIIEGFNYILVEKRKRFAEIIIPKRLEYWKNPGNWKLLKDHPLLPEIQMKINKKQNVSLDTWV